ncbi:hypothetical protein BGZ82_005949 [Podila clonocystis]|nr:hypothetical protein BGZ82_005949 [Podila clonocystis]
MLANAAFRPLLVAAAIAFMIMATIEAAPASEPLRCDICVDPPECNAFTCGAGYYCRVNYCTCQQISKPCHIDYAKE